MNPLSPNNKLLLRNAILIQTEAASPVSLTTDIIFQGLKSAGYPISYPLLQKTLAYLSQKQLILQSQHNLSQNISRFSITAQGIDYLEKEGLI